MPRLRSKCVGVKISFKMMTLCRFKISLQNQRRKIKNKPPTTMMAWNSADICYHVHNWQYVMRGVFWGCWWLPTISLPFPYYVLTNCLPLHVQNWEQDVRGAILGLLVFAYHFLTNFLPSPYNFFTSCTVAELTAKCEGSHFGIAYVCIPFPNQ